MAVSSPIRFVDLTVKFLFIHQNFPGQFLHLVRHLVAMREHEIVFITEANANAIEGVRKVPYMKPRPASGDTHIAARELFHLDPLLIFQESVNILLCNISYQ